MSDTTNRKVNFSAQDNGISSFMKRLQNDSKALYSDLAKEAQKQSKSQQEQLKFIEAQIRLLKTQNQLEKEQNRIILERKREAGIISPSAYAKEMASLKDDERVNSLQVKLLQQILNDKKEENTPQEKRDSVFSGVLAANLVRDLFGLIRQGAGAQTGLDLVSPFAQIAGGVAGGITGSAIDAANVKVFGTGLGNTNMGVIMSQAGKEISGLAADLVTRSFRIRDQYDQQYLRYQAIGGRERSSNLSSLGFDDIAVAGAMANVSGAMGTARNSSRNANLMLALSRLGFSDESTTLAAFGSQRLGGNGGQNIQRALGIAIAEGLDRAKFSDAIRSQTELIKTFAETSTRVSGTDVNRTLFEFNRIGGEFALGDPRAMANINKLNQGISNPNTAFGQALSYQILRQQNPGLDFWSLETKRQQGIKDPRYISGLMQSIKQLVPDNESLQKAIFSENFGGGLSNAAINTLFANGSKNIGSMSSKELSKMIGVEDLQSEASKFTSLLSKQQAEVTNAFRDNFMQGIYAIENQFETQMKKAVDEVSDYFKKKFGIGEADLIRNVDPKAPLKNGNTRVYSVTSKVYNDFPADKYKSNYVSNSTGYK